MSVAPTRLQSEFRAFDEGKGGTSGPDIRHRPPDFDGVGPAAEPVGRPERRQTSRRRLVIELSPDLHRRILTISAARGMPVNLAVREVLERAFPAGQAGGS